MKAFNKIALLILVFVLTLSLFAGCSIETSAVGGGAAADINKTEALADKFANSQQTPTDIDYSLERFNLIRRAYWVNGQREKAISLPCPVDRPLGYIVLFAGNTVFGTYVVDGKVSSLNSFLTPDSEYYERAMGDSSYSEDNKWLPDVDGSYGSNDEGIFFFTPDGNYYEWTGEYMYSDVPQHVNNPVLQVETVG